jgi:hypothetical protein
MSSSLWDVELPAEVLSLNYNLSSNTVEELLTNVRTVLKRDDLSEWGVEYWSSVEKKIMEKYSKIH